MVRAGRGGRGMKRRDMVRLAGVAACGVAVGGLGAPAHGRPQEARRGFVAPRRAAYFRDLGAGRIRCELCPHACTLAPGERGRCRVRENRGGHGYTLAHGNPAVVQLEPVERKPFYHVEPGSRSFSLATAGCNLECGFCEVWDTALVDPEDVFAFDLPAEAIVAHARQAGARSVAFTLGEPVAYYEYMAAVAARAREAGLLSLMHSAGYIQPEPLARLTPLLDGANIDLKGFDPAFYRRVVGGELEPVLQSLKVLRRAGIHLEITTIVIPTLNDDPERIQAMCHWIASELGPDTPLHFSRFYPLYRLANLPPTPVSTLDRARSVALDAGLRYVYIAKVPGHDGEHTPCPGCHRTVVRRMGFMVESVDVVGGRCRFCQADVAGIWA
jgi:pyruvate formate lyase activating enzyme